MQLLVISHYALFTTHFSPLHLHVQQKPWRMDFDILTIAKNYLKALKAGKTGKELALFFHPDVIQAELPNRLNPKGVTSNLDQILERAEKSKKLLKAQNFEITEAVINEDTVAMQVTWTGVVATSVGTISTGQTMKGHFAMFLQFQNGQIIKQTNYNCFDDF